MKYYWLVCVILMCGCEQILGIRETFVVDDAKATEPVIDAAAAPTDAPEAPPTELVEVRLLNGATDQPLSTPVDVIIAGSGRGMVLDELGHRRAEFPAIDKVLRFGLQETATYPISLLVQVSGPGLLSTVQPVVLHERADVIVEVRVVAMESLPSGVHVAMASGVTNADGALTSPMRLDTKAASVTVPQGIVMHDEAGQPLVGGITVELAHYESGNAESLAAFPGGMEVSTDQGDGLFASAGLLSLEITDESGHKASTFSAGVVRAQVTVSAGLFNPQTGRELAVSDNIGLWSHNAETGEWTQEGEVQIGEGLAASFTISHLSIWNLDFKINKCDLSREIQIRVLSSFDLVDPQTAANFVYELQYANLDGTRPSFVRRFRAGDVMDAQPNGVNNVLQFRNAPNVGSGRVIIGAYWKSYDPFCLIRSEDFNDVDESLCETTPTGFGLYPVRPPNCPTP